MKWISVNENLPEKDCLCVVWNENRPFQFYISNYCKYFKEFEVYTIGSMIRLPDPICFHATHWALISPPEDKNEVD